MDLGCHRDRGRAVLGGQAVKSDQRIRGFHRCEPPGPLGGGGAYDLWATPNGVVYCGACKAYDLLPNNEARQAAAGDEGLDRFARKFNREVRKGTRS